MYNPNASYPREYHQILLSLNPDGTPLVLEMPSEYDAQQERLRYYNFLKWCRRPQNQVQAAHLQGRYNQVQIKVKGNQLIFLLRTAAAFAPVRSALQQALAAQGQALPMVQMPDPKPIPRHETAPMRPDLPPRIAPEPAPTQSAPIPFDHVGGTDEMGSFEMPEDEGTMAKLMEMVERSKQAPEPEPETRVGWFIGDN